MALVLALVYQYTGIPVCRYTDIPVYWYTGIQVQYCLSANIFLIISTGRVHLGLPPSVDGGASCFVGKMRNNADRALDKDLDLYPNGEEQAGAGDEWEVKEGWSGEVQSRKYRVF